MHKKLKFIRENLFYSSISAYKFQMLKTVNAKKNCSFNFGWLWSISQSRYLGYFIGRRILYR